MNKIINKNDDSEKIKINVKHNLSQQSLNKEVGLKKKEKFTKTIEKNEMLDNLNEIEHILNKRYFAKDNTSNENSNSKSRGSSINSETKI